MYGKLGVLETDGERVQCHICGRWYRHLGSHAWHSHGMTADEYREEYGLNRGQILVSTELHQLLRETCGVHLKSWIEEHPDEHKEHQSYRRPNSRYERRTQNRINLSKENKRRFENGIRPLQTPRSKARQKETMLKKIANGTHPFQQPESEASRLQGGASKRNFDLMWGNSSPTPPDNRPFIPVYSTGYSG